MESITGYVVTIFELRMAFFMFFATFMLTDFDVGYIF